ncbi:MAG: TonB-dependent receptor [Melioribacteraceae bacterium]|nr:TonB-dependent receptor [Melioribacteraceae bacterium]MCF8354731.1 TonB-dependent receptor [Melioribacteraceae bacterium]MCF8394360.1 TonB-dependent receptor [Melioribacteraceae bacterium]MCF8420070.1 TonB-dependent receptor [Melioribacteraceae bacterium]
MKLRIWLKFVSLLLFIIFQIITAQNYTGNLEGVVCNENNVPLEGVTIHIENINTKQTREGLTNSSGKFILVELPAGDYRFRTSAEFYQSLIIEFLSIHIGKTTSLGKLNINPLAYETEPILVTSEQNLIDPASSKLGINLNKNIFNNLPVDREFQSVTYLISQANKSYYGDQVNISGSTGLENAYFIDGINVTDPVDAATSIKLPYNFITEIEVITGGYMAEYGRSIGGIINVITPSGGNEFEADVFSFFTNNDLGGEGKTGIRNASISHFRDYDFGGSVSGPIINDKLWFFTAYNPKFQQSIYSISGIGNLKSSVTSHLFAAKITWHAAKNTSAILNIFGDPTIRHDIDELTEGTFKNKDLLMQKRIMGGINSSLKIKHIINNNIFLESTLSYLNQKETGEPETETGRTQGVFADLTQESLSGGRGYVQNDSYYRTSANAAATFLFSDHIIKGGIEFEDNGYNIELRNNFPLSVILKIAPSVYISPYMNFTGKVNNKILSAYLQDSWSISNRLLINAGLRWEEQYFYDYNGKNVQTLANQFQPRIGFVYQPFDLGNYKFSGSYGRFYEQIPSRFVGMNYINKVDYQVIFFEDPRTGNVEGDTTDFSAGPQQNIPGLKGEFYDEFTLGYEQNIFKDFVFGIKAIYRQMGEVLDDFIDLERGRYIIGNPGKGDIDFIPKLNRKYQAVEFTIRKLSGDDYNLTASYVLSRNYGNYTGIFNQDIGDFLPNANQIPDLPEQVKNSEGLLPNDRTHVFKFAGFYKFDFGLVCGTSIVYQSGTPLSEFGVDPYGLLLPVFINQRGTAGRTPALFDMNLRLKI